MTERQMIEWYLDLFTELYRKVDANEGALFRKKDKIVRSELYEASYNDYVFTHTVMINIVRRKLGRSNRNEVSGRVSAMNRLKTLVRNGLIIVENRSKEELDEGHIRLASYGLRYRISPEAHRIFNTLVQL